MNAEITPNYDPVRAYAAKHHEAPEVGYEGYPTFTNAEVADLNAKVHPRRGEFFDSPKDRRECFAKEELRFGSKGEARYNAVLTRDLVIQCRKHRLALWPVATIQRWLLEVHGIRVHSGGIHNVLRGATWGHVEEGLREVRRLMETGVFRKPHADPGRPWLSGSEAPEEDPEA